MNGGEAERTEATTREIALANRLLVETHHSVFITGDMNEREEYFCGFTKRAPMMKAAQGGQYTKGRKCRPPKRPTRRPGIDWIFGSKNIRFDNYQRRTGRLVSKITDHPVIFVDVEFKKKKKKKRRR